MNRVFDYAFPMAIFNLHPQFTELAFGIGGLTKAFSFTHGTDFTPYPPGDPHLGLSGFVAQNSRNQSCGFGDPDIAESVCQRVNVANDRQRGGSHERVLVD